MKTRIFILLLIIFLTPLHTAHAQFGSSNCVVTKVGNAGPSPTLPPGCSGIGGNYSFPLVITQVTGIATEMAAYSGGYSYEGHREHAGLDIGTPIAQHAPVFAVANGTVLSARDSCYVVSQGASCRIDISHDEDGLISSYTHINVNSGVRTGTKVQKGQQIGVVHYWPEYSNMDHLHFELQNKSVLDALGVPININPRNYLPELQQFKSVYGPAGTGAEVRSYTNSVGYFWADDGKEYAETYRNHPPCPGGGGCWAH